MPLTPNQARADAIEALARAGYLPPFHVAGATELLGELARGTSPARAEAIEHFLSDWNAWQSIAFGETMIDAGSWSEAPSPFAQWAADIATLVGAVAPYAHPIDVATVGKLARETYQHGIAHAPALFAAAQKAAEHAARWGLMLKLPPVPKARLGALGSIIRTPTTWPPKVTTGGPLHVESTRRPWVLKHHSGPTHPLMIDGRPHYGEVTITHDRPPTPGACVHDGTICERAPVGPVSGSGAAHTAGMMTYMLSVPGDAGYPGSGGGCGTGGEDEPCCDSCAEGGPCEGCGDPGGPDCGCSKRQQTEAVFHTGVISPPTDNLPPDRGSLYASSTRVGGCCG